jgi:hypothetical protein
MNGWRDSMSTVMFGVALVLVMATVLFALVGVNPKNAEYSTLPWVYGGACAAGSVACWVISRRLGRQLTAK